MSTQHQHPVFGPERTNAARAAMWELFQAREEVKERCHGWADYDSPASRERLAKAQEIRDMYPEYMDSSLGIL